MENKSSDKQEPKLDNSPTQLADSENIYLGWVPCISGHLNFSLISVGLAGSALADYKITCAQKYLTNIKIDQKHYSILFQSPDNEKEQKVILQSWVEWKDTPGKRDGQWRVVLIGTIEVGSNPDDTSISGFLCIYPRAYKSEFSEQNSNLMKIVSDCAVVQSKASTLKPFESEAKLKYQKQQNLLFLQLEKLIKSGYPLGQNPTPPEVYFTKFTIKHSGLAQISIFSPPTSETNTAPLITDKEQQRLCLQSYYYLKYSLHKHNHHTADSDALTTIIKAPSSGNIDIDRVGLTLLTQLKNELTTIKRSQKNKNKIDQNEDALGLLGYMKALARTCYESKHLKKSTYDREMAWIKATSGSFNAQQHKIERTIRSNLDKETRVRHESSLILAFTSIFSLVLVTAAKFGTPTQPLAQSSFGSFLYAVHTIEFNYIFLTWLIISILAVTFVRVLVFLERSIEINLRTAPAVYIIRKLPKRTIILTLILIITTATAALFRFIVT